ncbi:MAG: hypothetical protein M0P16_05830 [Syntrophales bacterium]|nr:hypothetical protein [Syntrophales bacterium]
MPKQSDEDRKGGTKAMKIRCILKMSCLYLLIAFMVVLGGNHTAIADDSVPPPGTCFDKEAGGIFLYTLGPTKWTFSIMNSTGTDLTVVGVPDPALFFPNDVVKAYTSKKFQYYVAGGAQRWEGNLAIKPGVGGSAYQFNVAFQKSAGLNGIYPSTWIYLPVPSSGPYFKIASSSTGQLVNGRWSTNMPVAGDHKMHNIMTIVSDKIVASLFTVNNKHVTLVVSDTLNNYTGTPLDWVWNDGRSVPTNCGLCCQSCPNVVDCSQ